METNKSMIFTLEDEETCEKQEICHICKEPFEEMDGDLVIPSLKGIKVRDHCHYTGKFRGAAHNGCNILYRKIQRLPEIPKLFIGQVSVQFGRKRRKERSFIF